MAILMFLGPKLGVQKKSIPSLEQRGLALRVAETNDEQVASEAHSGALRFSPFSLAFYPSSSSLAPPLRPSRAPCLPLPVTRP